MRAKQCTRHLFIGGKPFIFIRVSYHLCASVSKTGSKGTLVNELQCPFLLDSLRHSVTCFKSNRIENKVLGTDI